MLDKGVLWTVYVKKIIQFSEVKEAAKTDCPNKHSLGVLVTGLY